MTGDELASKRFAGLCHLLEGSAVPLGGSAVPLGRSAVALGALLPHWQL